MPSSLLIQRPRERRGRTKHSSASAVLSSSVFCPPADPAAAVSYHRCAVSLVCPYHPPFLSACATPLRHAEIAPSTSSTSCSMKCLVSSLVSASASSAAHMMLTNIRSEMAFKVFGPRNMQAFSPRLGMFDEVFCYGPFNRSMQRRWKKPVDSARTRLEGRTRDHRLDKLMIQLRNLRLALDLHEVISQQRNDYASLQLLLRWRHEIGLNIEIGSFLKKYPHIFEIYMHPVKRNHCCKITKRMVDLVAEEDAVTRENEPAVVQRLKKLLMMSMSGTQNMHALWLIRKELGLPDDYRCSILPNHQSEFSLETPDTLTLISWDEYLAVANIEEWRDKEYTEKWLAEYETKFAFPISFPTGFRIEKGFKEKVKNWQRLPYTKPYEKKDSHPIINVERLEKRIIGILHELLSSTVEKMIPLERLSHFRKPFGMEVNLREILLKHPGIFYISTKGSTQTVILRESYNKGCLVEPNPVYSVRRKMLDLILSGCRNIGETGNAIWCVEEDSQRSSHGPQNNTCQVDTMSLQFESDCDSY